MQITPAIHFCIFSLLYQVIFGDEGVYIKDLNGSFFSDSLETGLQVALSEKLQMISMTLSRSVELLTKKWNFIEIDTFYLNAIGLTTISVSSNALFNIFKFRRVLITNISIFFEQNTVAGRSFVF